MKDFEKKLDEIFKDLKSGKVDVEKAKMLIKELKNERKTPRVY